MEITTLYAAPRCSTPEELIRLREGIFSAYKDMPATIELEAGLNMSPVGLDKLSSAHGTEAIRRLKELGIDADFGSPCKDHYDFFLIKNRPVYSSSSHQAPHDTEIRGWRKIYSTNTPDKLAVHEVRDMTYAGALAEGVALITWTPEKVAQFRREVASWKN